MSEHPMDQFGGDRWSSQAADRERQEGRSMNDYIAHRELEEERRLRMQAERERDGARAAVEMWQREVSGRDADIDRLRALLRDIRPLLADVMKLASDLGQPTDYDNVAALVDRLDAALKEEQ